ncbi:MAG TPA: hypothetical protein VIH72_01685 [Candidatus Acidoferrales bacterium]|jgi:hypothetical protein
MKKPNRDPLTAVIVWLLAAGTIYSAFYLIHGRILSFTLGVIGGFLIALAILFSGWTIG